MRKFAIALVAVALVAAACGGTSGQPADPADPADPVGEAPVVAADDVGRTIDVTLTEFTFTFNGAETLSVSAGETVRFVVTNEGVVDHEFRLTTRGEVAQHLEAGHEGHGDVASIDTHEEVLLLVAPFRQETITVTFDEAGEYNVVACLIPGHYEAGMWQPVEYS